MRTTIAAAEQFALLVRAVISFARQLLLFAFGVAGLAVLSGQSMQFDDLYFEDVSLLPNREETPSKKLRRAARSNELPVKLNAISHRQAAQIKAAGAHRKASEINSPARRRSTPHPNWLYAAGALSFAAIPFYSIKIYRSRRKSSKSTSDKHASERQSTEALNDGILASISHEIRNPMNGIIGLVGSIKRENLDADTQGKVELLRYCAAHLSSLLDDILDISSIQAGEIPLDVKPFTLPDLLDSVAALTAAESESRGIPVEIILPLVSPGTLIGDARRIRQILTNYINNALKYSREGKVIVSVQSNQSALGLPEITFGVADNGPGIALKDQAKLFTRFERGAHSQLSQVPGNGIGLALCKVLAEKMGGRVWLKSDPGNGAQFYFSAHFPCSEAGAESVAPTISSPRNHRSLALIVDDMEYNRLGLSGLLESLGITSRMAADDCAALTLAQRHNFDLIFLDYSLPGLDGPAIARAIRALPNRSAQAIIFATTAANTPTKRAACRAAGINMFLDKPITIERLRCALDDDDAKTTPAQIPLEQKTNDPLARLRLIATRKQVPLALELSLYLSELTEELDHFNRALALEDSGRATYFAHLLYGRCSFIGEHNLEQTLRHMESAAIRGDWDQARDRGDEVLRQFTELRVRLTPETQSSQPV